MTQDSYDIVGDIHGHADALRRLLRELGYRERSGIFRHPTRRVIFVGDFIDRGPEQRDVVGIAQRMHEGGSALAVMGNHEFNAIGWATPDPDGGFLRDHNDKNFQQHQEFLRQFGDNSAQHRSAIDWFKSLPVLIDLNHIRVAHACWHPASIGVLRSHTNHGGTFTEEAFVAANRKETPLGIAANVVLKGTELPLPAPLTFIDKDGHLRHEVRTKWWDSTATTFRSAAIGADDVRDQLPDSPLPIGSIYSEPTPVFFGHYWLTGTPGLTSPNAACLDYSVAKSGFLTAYRWSGESVLMEGNLVSVAASDR